METFEINYSNDKEPIKVNYFSRKDSGKLIIVVGGWEDTKDTLIPLVNYLTKKGLNKSFATFSFRGYETRKYRPYINQVKDLEEVVRYFIEVRNINEITFINTSDGAVSTTYLLVFPKYSKHIKQAVYLDPADYYIQTLSKLSADMFIWPGYLSFEPSNKTVADLLVKINSQVQIDVVKFILRNYTENGYAKERDKDNPKYFPRLNTKMVRNFYEKTPKKNRGKYVEINGIPHAFIRDGNVAQNVKKIGDLVYKLLK